MQSKLVLTIMFLGVVSACDMSGAGAALSSVAVAGCYRFSWTRSDSVLQDGFLYPDLVRLGPEPSCPECDPDSRGAKYLSVGSPLPDTIRYAPGKLVPWHRLYYASWWQIAAPDTVVIAFNANVERWDVRLTPAGRVLRGRADFWSDGGIIPSTSVTAVRTSCAIAA